VGRYLMPKVFCGKWYDNQHGLRLGTQEVVRWGMGPTQMSQVARFITRLLIDEE
jgi:glycine/serine hydroxymethyltransferase